MGQVRGKHRSAFDGVRVSWKVVSLPQTGLEYSTPLRAFDGVVRVRSSRPMHTSVPQSTALSPYEALRRLVGGIQGIMRVPKIQTPTYAVS